MKEWDVRTAPLTELVGFLADIYADTACTCECKPETWYRGDGKWDSAIRIAKEQENECKRKDPERYAECPERIAYERVYAVCEKYEREAEK